MEKIAFIIGETILYWNSIILMLSCAAAVGLFLFFYLRQPGNGLGAALLVPLAAGLSLVLSRVVDWYCRTDARGTLEQALTDFSGGGYALAGVFAGCVLAAVLLRLLRVIRNLPMALDCMALAGCAGIGLGRLSCLYTQTGRGFLLEHFGTFLPGFPAVNAVTGEPEWRLATFLLQAVCAGILFLVLTVWYLAGQRGENRKVKDGDAAWLFAALYGASQVLLDSTRCDSRYLPGLGFVSLVQILGAAGLLLSCVVFSVRLVKSRGFRWQYVPVWMAFPALTGAVGFLECRVLPRGGGAALSYGIMGASLAVMAALVCLLRLWARKSGEAA